MAGSSAQPLRLLYLTARDPDSGENMISPASRIAIGTLSRDFRVSLAVVGDMNTVGMNRLRVDLGPVRVAGGLESSGADARAKSGLRQLMRARHGTATFNARLQAAIQRKADDFDAIVVDDLIAWSYRPATRDIPIVYLAREVCSTQEAPKTGIFRRLRNDTLRDYELALFDEVDHIFARPEIAHQIGEIGVPMRLLQDNFSRPGSGSPTFGEAEFSLTGNRVGYIGYLGFQQNLASLDWFLNGVWPDLRMQRPGIELHVVGGAPEEGLQRRLNDLEDVYLHWGSNDRKLLELGCRVVVDPLLYETHVDAKMVNAMARSLPVVTTRSAISRAHSNLESGVTVADSPEQMVRLTDQLMSNAQLWKDVSEQARSVAMRILPDYEVAHAIRRVLARMHPDGAAEHD